MERISRIRRANIAADIDNLRNQYNNIFNTLFMDGRSSVDDVIRETDGLFRNYLSQYGMPRNVERYVDNEEYWENRGKFRTMKVRILEELGYAYKNGTVAGRQYKVIPVSDHVRDGRHYNVGHVFIATLPNKKLRPNDVTELKKEVKDWKGIRPGERIRKFGDPFGSDYMNYEGYKRALRRKGYNDRDVAAMDRRVEETYREYVQDHFLDGVEKPLNDVIENEQGNLYPLKVDNVRYSQYTQYAAARFKNELKIAERRAYEDEMQFEQDVNKAPRVKKSTGGMGTMSAPRTVYNISEMVKKVIRYMLNQQQNFFNQTERREIWFNRDFRMRYIIDHLIFNYMEMKLPELKDFDFKVDSNRNRDGSIRYFYTQRFFLDLGERLLVDDVPLNENSEFILNHLQRYINARFYDDDLEWDERLNGDEILAGNFSSVEAARNVRMRNNNYSTDEEVSIGKGDIDRKMKERKEEARKAIRRAEEIVRQYTNRRTDDRKRDRDDEFTDLRERELDLDEDSDDDSDASTVLLDDISDFDVKLTL